MRFFKRLFYSAPAPAAPVQPQAAKNLAASQLSTRRELLRVVLRDTLIKHGIPTAWVGCEMVQAMGRTREPGMHLRLLVRHWDPRLLTYGVALEKSLAARVMVFDPSAAGWLAGMSWQFSLASEEMCPPLPAPSTWTAAAVVVTELDDEAVTAMATEPPAKPHARAELDRLFAETDAKVRKRYADDPVDPDDKPNFEATQPMFRSTEPAPL
ncbi:MAG: hypothetical protein HYX47_11230 [Burkholderiales bacterium]|nr:hypothetical protein [Burkholderiales bacterium]